MASSRAARLDVASVVTFSPAACRLVAHALKNTSDRQPARVIARGAPALRAQALRFFLRGLARRRAHGVIHLALRFLDDFRTERRFLLVELGPLSENEHTTLLAASKLVESAA